MVVNWVSLLFRKSATQRAVAGRASTTAGAGRKVARGRSGKRVGCVGVCVCVFVWEPVSQVQRSRIP